MSCSRANITITDINEREWCSILNSFSAVKMIFILFFHKGNRLCVVKIIHMWATVLLTLGNAYGRTIDWLIDFVSSTWVVYQHIIALKYPFRSEHTYYPWHLLNRGKWFQSVWNSIIHAKCRNVAKWFGDVDYLLSVFKLQLFHTAHVPCYKVQQANIRCFFYWGQQSF